MKNLEKFKIDSEKLNEINGGDRPRAHQLKLTSIGINSFALGGRLEPLHMALGHRF